MSCISHKITLDLDIFDFEHSDIEGMLDYLRQKCGTLDYLRQNVMY